MSEWFKEVVLKTTDGVSYPGVRIPLHPGEKKEEVLPAKGRPASGEKTTDGAS